MKFVHEIHKPHGRKMNEIKLKWNYTYGQVTYTSSSHDLIHV